MCKRECEIKEKETEFAIIGMAQRDEPFVPTLGSSQYEITQEEIEEALHYVNEIYWETEKTEKTQQDNNGNGPTGQALCANNISITTNTKTTENDQSPKQPKEITGMAQQDKTVVPIIIGIIIFITTIIIAV